MAADGHFGVKSKELVKHYAEDLGFEYISAKDKEEFLENIEHFVLDDKAEKSIIFEIFTNSDDESNALKTIRNLESSFSGSIKNNLKRALSPDMKKTIKKVIGK